MILMSITVYSNDSSSIMDSVLATATRNWLTSNWSADKYVGYSILRINPLLRAWFDIQQGHIDNTEYLNRHGMTWSDTTHPWRLPGNGSIMAGTSGAYNYVSDNLERLYK